MWHAFGQRLLRPLLILALAVALGLFVVHETTEEDFSSALIACLALSVVVIRAAKRSKQVPAGSVAHVRTPARAAPPQLEPFLRPRLTPLRL